MPGPTESSAVSDWGAGLHLGNSINDVFVDLCSALLMFGSAVERRGSTVLEFNGPQLIEIGTPRNNVLTVQGRNSNPWVTMAEFPWLIAGRNDIAWLTHYLPRAKDFSDDGTTWRAGYGPRLRDWYNNIDQLAYVVSTLRGDPMSRQAVISLWDPEADTFPSKDIPCTNWMHFQIVGGKLDLTVAMRSNDIVWGFSGVNVFNFTTLQELVASAVGVKTGVYRHLSSNLHLYERHFDMVSMVMSVQQQCMYDYIEPVDVLFGPDINLSDFTHECNTALRTVWFFRSKEIDIPHYIEIAANATFFTWLNQWVYFMLLHSLTQQAVPVEVLRTALGHIHRVDWKIAATQYILNLHVKKNWISMGEANSIAADLGMYTQPVAPAPAPGGNGQTA